MRIDQIPIHPHMVLKALQAKDKGRAALRSQGLPGGGLRRDAAGPTPEQGGDGRAINDYREKLRSGMRSASGTMMSREEALKKKKVAVLTTGPEGAR